MNLSDQLLRAITLAVNAHANQLDRQGQPYIGHCFRVMNAGRTLEEKIVGVLHDVVEDTDLTFRDLLLKGFSEEVVDAVHTLTKLDNEDYDHYINRVMADDLATRVKINDLADNMDIRRLKEIKPNDITRLRKYLKAYNLLTDK